MRILNKGTILYVGESGLNTVDTVQYLTNHNSTWGPSRCGTVLYTVPLRGLQQKVSEKFFG